MSAADASQPFDWSRSPITGRVVLGAIVGRTTFAETLKKTDARIAALTDLRQRLGSLLVSHLDWLATGAPVETVAAAVVRAVDQLAGRAEGTDDAVQL